MILWRSVSCSAPSHLKVRSLSQPDWASNERIDAVPTASPSSVWCSNRSRAQSAAIDARATTDAPMPSTFRIALPPVAIYCREHNSEGGMCVKNYSDGSINPWHFDETGKIFELHDVKTSAKLDPTDRIQDRQALKKFSG